jgi:CheY-like chemotaxis protein
VKFTPELGQIRLSACLKEEKDGFCEILTEVRDTGIGISPEQQARLFTSFEQVDSGASRKFGGTGLGLAISKGIVDLMGGSLWVESELGAGATFSFTVRLKKGAPEAQTRLALQPGAGNWRALTVDAMPETAVYMSGVLGRLGIACDIAASGDEAAELIKRKGAYDICFLDGQAPETASAELLGLIKETGGGRSRIVLTLPPTGSLTDEQLIADSFLTRPLFPSAIAECINNFIGAAGGEGGETPQQEETAIFKGRRVLLAEDIEVNREIVLALLETTALEIDCAVNGVEAVKMFSEAPDRYDLIFMDIQMPEMDGYEATRRIRSLGGDWAQRIPIIAMTANVFREDIEKCLESGMNGHVGKPLNAVEVMASLREHLPPGQRAGDE